MCDGVQRPVWDDDDDISDAEFEAVALEFVDQGLLELVVHEGELGFRLTPRGRIAFDIPAKPKAIPSSVPTTGSGVINPVGLT